MCLSLEVLHTLEYCMQVPSDNSQSVTELLDALESHVKSKMIEALCCRNLSSCKQVLGETFNNFYVCVKSLAEDMDIYKAEDNVCE